MKTPEIAGIILAVAALAGCVEDTGYSDNVAAPVGMNTQCVNQASRMTSTPSGAIEVTSQIETGGGPLVTLNVAGSPYSCRQEANGSVTVFSEYAG